MEFRNLTPFPALCFLSLDTDDMEHRSTVMRVTYRIEPGEHGSWVLAIEDEAPPPLSMEDRFEGEMNQSSILEESDLAPWKPFCDVVIQAVAHAPEGRATRSFQASIRLAAPNRKTEPPLRPRGLNPYMEPSAEQLAEWEKACERLSSAPAKAQVLLEKTLVVTGEREWRKRAWPVRFAWSLARVASLGLIRRNPWKLTPPKPFTNLPLRYDHAFGGACRIDQGAEKAAKRVPKSARLSPEAAAAHIDAKLEASQRPVAHTFEPRNPIGVGFAESWFIKATRTKRVPAPRITYPQAPLTAKTIWHSLKGKLKHPHPSTEPAGFGFIGRSWQPRIALAGTWDETWIRERHPRLPLDFDFAYWNGAPKDQQIPYPPADVEIALTNLTPEGELRFRLPGHRAFLTCRWVDGTIEAKSMEIDTLIIDTEQRSVTVLWRGRVAEDANLRVMESRFETDPAKPLLTWADDAATCPVESEVA